MDRFLWYSSDGAVEEIKIQAGGVGLFDGEEKHSSFESGTASLTSIRLIWVDSNDRNSRLSLLHSYVHKIERQQKSLLNRTAKIVIHLVDGPNSTNKVRMHFKSGGDEHFFNFYSEMLAQRDWERPASSQVPVASARSQRPASGGSAGLGGIAAVQRNLEAQHNRSSQTINQAFEDLSKLMETAGNMVDLSKRISEKLRAKQGDITEDETIKFKSYLLSLGVNDPVTKATHGSTAQYYKELAKEIVTVLKLPIQESGGLMSLPDVYCRLNRARGLELISPDDLWNACNLLNDMKLDLRLVKFDSGVLVLQLAEFSLEATVTETQQLVQAAGHISSHDLAHTLNISIILAEQRLLAAEQYGALCRDDSMEGHRFYPNLFSQPAAVPTAAATAAARPSKPQPQQQPQPQQLPPVASVDSAAAAASSNAAGSSKAPLADEPMLE